MTLGKKLWLGVIALILLSPLGLLLPDHFKAGAAWGEWGAEEIRSMVGYIPQGLEKFSALWKAPLPDYVFKGWEEKGLGALGIAYVFSALVGAAVTVGFVLLLGKVLAKKDD